MSYSGTQTTRLGLAAIPRAPYGSFAGRTPADTSVTAATGHRLSILPDDRVLAVRPDTNRISVH